MIIKLDPSSDLIIRQLRMDDDIIALGAAYIAYEMSLPVESRNAHPPLAEVNAAYEAAAAAAASVDRGEHKRAAAGELFAQTMAQVEKKLHWALAGRMRQFPETPAMIEAWGVNTVQGAHGRHMVLPTRLADWQKLLDDYIAHEESLPVDQQWSDPPLTDFETLREQMETSDMNRMAGRSERVQAVWNRQIKAAVLKEALNLAIHSIIYYQFGGKIDPALSNWGVNVRYRQNGSSKTAVPEEEEGAPEPETAVTP